MLAPCHCSPFVATRRLQLLAPAGARSLQGGSHGEQGHASAGARGAQPSADDVRPRSCWRSELTAARRPQRLTPWPVLAALRLLLKGPARAPAGACGTQLHADRSTWRPCRRLGLAAVRRAHQIESPPVLAARFCLQLYPCLCLPHAADCRFHQLTPLSALSAHRRSPTARASACTRSLQPLAHRTRVPSPAIWSQSLLALDVRRQRTPAGICG